MDSWEPCQAGKPHPTFARAAATARWLNAQKLNRWLYRAVSLPDGTSRLERVRKPEADPTAS